MTTLGAILALVSIGVAFLVLIVITLIMVIGAIVPRRAVSSWPAHEEGAFQPYEQRYLSSHSRAWLISVAVAAATTIAALGIYIAVPPHVKDVSKSMNMQNLTKKSDAK